MIRPLTGVSQRMRDHLAPWLEWAETEPMTSKIVMALNILDADKDAVVSFDDLANRATSQRHKKVTHHREVRELFNDLKKHAKGKKELREAHIKKTLEDLSAEELADVIAELPTFLAKQPKTFMLKTLGDKFIGNAATQVATELLTRIGAPHVTPNVATGLLASMGSQIKPEKGRS